MSTESIVQLFDLTGKHAVVTGGALGIGQGIALRLAESGAKVMIADVDLDNAGQTVEQIKKAGGESRAVKANMARTEDIKKIIQETLAAFGGLDILINNAGISPLPFRPAMETSEDTWDQVMDVNLKGMFLLSQAAAREMIKQGRGGKIINIASVAAVHHEPNMIHYSASKAGVVSITHSLARELAPHNILVNAIGPGGVMTSAARASFKDRGIDPQLAYQRGDIANVALFLASRASDYMTGSLVIVDGGRLLM